MPKPPLRSGFVTPAGCVMTTKNDISQLLEKNEKYRLDNPSPSQSELGKAELELGKSLTDWYKEFVLLGGLNDLRFSAEILSPDELIGNQEYIKNSEYTAFASDGCGGLFCWDEENSGSIFYWDHETNEFSEVSNNFIKWLESNRF